MLFHRIFSLILFFSFASVQAQYMVDDRLLELESSSGEYVRDEFLVNVRVFEFNSDKLEPWIEGITHLRAFGVDFRKGKGADGLYQYVDDEKMEEFIDFTNRKGLKIIWTLNVSSFTLEHELKYVDDIISRGLNIVGFQYGGEFWLKKYAYGEMNSKGVVEKIRMDAQNRDYLDLLDTWVPAVIAVYPLNDYLHIFVTASESSENNLTMNYRREFNRKVFNYVTENPALNGKIDFSYHLYAGAKPGNYKRDEENVLKPEKVDWSFIAKKPQNSRWIVTESGYYTKTWSEEDLREARKFYTLQSEKLGEDALMGIHVLYIADRGQNNLALYNLNGRTPVGDNIAKWLNGNTDESPGPDNSSEPYEGNNDPDIQENNMVEPVLETITPEYEGGFFQWIHFSHKLAFSNGKSYKRSYWFSSPDFTKDDLGKPISYFKRVVKNK